MIEHRNILPALIIIGLFVVAPFAAVLAKDPSPEQCTCDLKGFDTRTGADVVNAASCVQELRHPWCDIYLATTEDSGAHADQISIFEGAASDADLSNLERLLLDLMDRYRRAALRDHPDRADQYGADLARIKNRLGQESTWSIMQACLNSFIENKHIVNEGEGFACAVGSKSGWLNLQFELDDHIYRFLFAPS